jgi:hypothetical protein
LRGPSSSFPGCTKAPQQKGSGRSGTIRPRSDRRLTRDDAPWFPIDYSGSVARTSSGLPRRRHCEAFDDDTLRLNENNLRIDFQDTGDSDSNTSVVLGDLNGDGRTDLIAGHRPALASNSFHQKTARLRGRLRVRMESQLGDLLSEV